MNEEINELSGGPILPSHMINPPIERATGIYKINNDYQIDSTWVISNDNVVIDGQGHTIYGHGKQAFDIKGSSVTIKNLNFVNCSSGKGGAICFKGAKGNVSGCSFVGCSADDGGAIYSYGSSEVNHCNFVYCSAHDYGGAISFIKDSFVFDCSIVFDCSFVNCSSGVGGAIYFGGRGTVGNCKFVNCSANYYEYSAIYDINQVTVLPSQLMLLLLMIPWNRLR